jgi:hypothetical protein
VVRYSLLFILSEIIGGLPHTRGGISLKSNRHSDFKQELRLIRLAMEKLECFLAMKKIWIKLLK